MNTKQLIIRYAFWALLLVLSVALFFGGFNKNRYFSMPIEVFAIVMGALLVIAAYLLKLKNRYFLGLLWLAALGSTIAVTWFFFLFIAHPFGTEATAIVYVIAGLFIGWKYLKK